MNYNNTKNNNKSAKKLTKIEELQQENEMLRIEKTLDNKKQQYLKEYLQKYTFSKREFGKKYLTKLIKSMSRFENITYDDKTIDQIIDREVRIEDFEDIETLFKLKDTWKYILETMFDDLTINYILDINHMVSHHQSLETKTLCKCSTSVAYITISKIPNPKDCEKFLTFILSKRCN